MVFKWAIIMWPDHKFIHFICCIECIHYTIMMFGIEAGTEKLHNCLKIASFDQIECMI